MSTMSKGFNQGELSRVTTEFTQQFEAAGYQVEIPVGIASGIDPSVRLIGAPISVLKPYLTQSETLENGIYIVQNCIRTHNLRTLLELDKPQEYGSFFTGLGALAVASETPALFQETSNLLFDRLKIDPNDAFVSVCSMDGDFVDAASQNGVYEVRPDVMKAPYYRHEYGVEGVFGRNSSYWVKNSVSGEFEDIGNVIIIENEDGDSLGVEFAFGDTTLVKQMQGLEHVTDAYRLRLSDSKIPKNIRIRLEDCIVTSMALASENLQPGARNNQTRILRSYIKGLSLFRRLADLDSDTLGTKLEEYEEGYFPFNAKNSGKLVLDWAIAYENQVASNGAANKEDNTILSVMDAYGK